ncbi:hypothetical protein M885DRAFT_541576 [Pelagophyceae sp. CCMP2097]|nr:hypothetical protein M885DRAFT_541576 [Pelagophyceae sp. CCMP2097]
MPPLLGSMHTHTNGWGYGAFQEGPPSARPDYSLYPDQGPSPDFGRSTSWKHVHEARRLGNARNHLVSGEIGSGAANFATATKRRWATRDLSYLETPRETPRTARSPKGHPLLMSTEPRIDAPVAGLSPSARPRDARGLSLENGALDPIFRASHFRQDLALSRRPKDFHASMPFGATTTGATAGANTAIKIFQHNETSAGLTTHWSHGLRGCRY